MCVCGGGGDRESDVSRTQVHGMRDCMYVCVRAGVRYYHKFKNYARHAVTYKVIAFRLGDVVVPPIRPLCRTDVIALNKFLTEEMCATQHYDTKWLTKVSSGSFAYVFRFKRCTGLPP